MVNQVSNEKQQITTILCAGLFEKLSLLFCVFSIDSYFLNSPNETEKPIEKTFTNQRWKLSNVNFGPIVNIRNGTYRKLLNLKLFFVTCLLYTRVKRLRKASNKILKLKLWQVVTEYMAKSKKSQAKLGKTKELRYLLVLIFWHLLSKIYFLRGDWVVGRVLISF